MTTEKMTVYKALVDRKTMEARINNAMDADMVICNRNNNAKISGKTVEEIKTVYKANFDKLQSLMARNEAMNMALNQSNATTMISVNGTEMSMAMALWMKKPGGGLDLKKEEIRVMKNKYATSVTLMNNKNSDDLDRKVENYLISTFGSCEKGIKTDEMVKAEEIYRKNNSWDLIDPCKLKDVIDQKQDELDKFESELDSAIQISNAVTTIEFSY